MPFVDVLVFIFVLFLILYPDGHMRMGKKKFAARLTALVI
jgi:hypothetical protein